MKIYCIEEFYKAYLNLCSKKHYNTLEKDIIDYFFNKKVDDLLSGIRLNISVDTPYLKKRLEGSGGYRFYFLVIIKNEALYLMFVHPKTGPNGADNLKKESIAKIYKDVLQSIKENNLQEVLIKEGKLHFKKLDVKSLKPKLYS